MKIEMQCEAQNLLLDFCKKYSKLEAPNANDANSKAFVVQRAKMIERAYSRIGTVERGFEDRIQVHSVRW